MKGHPAWPGKIVIPPEAPDLKRPGTKKLLHCVKFFGTHDYGWLGEQEVKPYQAFRDALSGGSKLLSFQRALKEIEECMLGKNIIKTITAPVALPSTLVESSIAMNAASQTTTPENIAEDGCNQME